MSIVSPVPYFPRIRVNSRWAKLAATPQCERFSGFQVDHPRYVVFPKLGMMTHGLSMFAGSLLRVARRMRETDCDLIDAHYVYPDGMAAVMLGAMVKKPVVVSARGSDINLFPKFRSIRPMIQYVLTKADAVIAVSEPLKRIMIDLGCPSEKITVVPNGVDPDKFKRHPRHAARERLGLPERPIALSVGRLSENKGFHLLIQAASQLRQKWPDLMLVIVGDGLYRTELEAQVRKLGAEQVVTFTGEVPNEQLAKWYSAADLFCLASEREGCPNVVLESIACGCPVIASPVGGIREIIRTPVLGSLVPRTAEAFASAIDHALCRKWDHEAITRHGRSYRWDEVTRSILKIYSQVTSRCQ